jgi:hypothetical protein
VRCRLATQAGSLSKILIFSGEWLSGPMDKAFKIDCNRDRKTNFPKQKAATSI